MSEISQFIASIGFPIFVAVWMLYKTSQDSKEMQEAITKLEIAITKLTDELHHSDHDSTGGQAA